MKAARFTADEIERVNYLTTKGYLPVAVDVASRVFQVCYCIQRKKGSYVSQKWHYAFT